MSDTVKYNSSGVRSDVSPISKSAAQISSAGSTEVILGENTTLDGALTFAEVSRGINKRMQQLSEMLSMDVKDALRVVGNIEGIDDELARQNS